MGLDKCSDLWGSAGFRDQAVPAKHPQENKIQIFGGPILDDDLPLKPCWAAPRGTAHVDMHHLKLKVGYMVEEAGAAEVAGPRSMKPCLKHQNRIFSSPRYNSNPPKTPLPWTPQTPQPSYM